jgi:ABC-type branched-subunit amino acid transport system substrate-binding protein
MIRKRFAVICVCALVLTACGNAGDDDDAGGDDDGSGNGATTIGVTDTEVLVGGLVSLTGPLAQQFKGSDVGAQAYFDLVNERGGIHGRKIRRVDTRNDNTDPARNESEAHALVEEDKVFAVVPLATPEFASAEYLGDEGIPVFGWRIQDEWNDHMNFFAHVGTYGQIKGADPSAGGAYLPKRLGFTKVGAIGYTQAQSADCVDGLVRNFEAAGLDVVYNNKSLPLGTADFTADAQRMKDAGVEYVATCIDTNGNLNLTRALQRVGHEVAMSWPTGYEQKVLEEYGDLMENTYFLLQHLPFESAEEFSPGLQEYLEEFPRLAPDGVVGNQSLIGWVNAKLFVEGLDAVGPDLTREKLIDTINAEFTDWDADGIIWKLDWSVQHTDFNPYGCSSALVSVDDGKFVHAFGKPFNCLIDVDTPEQLDAYIAAEDGGATPEEAREAALAA